MVFYNICTIKFKTMCRLSFTKQIRVGCYTKYLTFKHTSWTEILHEVAEFHSIVLHGWMVSLRLIEKDEWVCLICIEGRPGLMKIKAGFYIKYNLDNYHEATATREKKEIWKIKNPKNSCETFFLLKLGF